MLQYRHKSRAWRAMVTPDGKGNLYAIKDKIKQGIIEGENGKFDKDADIEVLMERLCQIRGRLERRVSGLPDNNTLRQHLRKLDDKTLRTLVVSGPWDTFSVGGEEVDVDLLFENPDLLATPGPKQPERIPVELRRVGILYDVVNLSDIVNKEDGLKMYVVETKKTNG